MIEIVKIKKHIKQIRGISYGGNDSINNPQEGYLPILRSNNINEGSLNFENLVYVPINLVKTYQLLKKGDLVITASTGSIKVIGKNGAVQEDYIGSFGAFCKVVRPLESINPGYLKHFFQSNYYRKTIQNVINGANINNIKNEHLDDLLIPFPNLPTQQKIANILDKADELRQYNKQLVEKYDALTQSLFFDMFGDPVNNEKGWEVKNGNEYCEKISVGVVIRPASYYVDKGVIALRSLNIKPNRIDLKDLVYFSKINSETTLAKSQLKTDDVVIVRTGSTGTAAIIPKELDNCNCIDLIITRPNKSIINPLYLVYFFNSERGKNIVSGHEVGGIQKHFNIGSIKNLNIPTPPVNFQNKFAERVQLIETQKKQAQEALEKSEALFQSLLQKAFKGELN
ncbi:restriction endonuclease subunit S [Flavobacterium anhuiense]|uniref:restriction endonuclease subunit S n=1 Tax=Flavobacterium anhuiense TaxID=459526 RepID=UPI003D991F28